MLKSADMWNATKIIDGGPAMHRIINSVMIFFIFVLLVVGFCWNLHKSNKTKNDEKSVNKQML